MTGPRIVSVNVVHALVTDPIGRVGRTAIDKRPVEGPVAVQTLGLVGDTVLDRAGHGGIDKAVYAYAQEDLAAWAAELGRALAPGTFGENLTTGDLPVTDAVIGEHWEVDVEGGEPVELEVSMPRTPCVTFQGWMQEPHWVKRFTEHGAPGAYLRVLSEGRISPGSAVRVTYRPTHGVTIGEVFARRPIDPERVRAVLAQPGLAPEVVAALGRQAF